MNNNRKLFIGKPIPLKIKITCMTFTSISRNNYNEKLYDLPNNDFLPNN